MKRVLVFLIVISNISFACSWDSKNISRFKVCGTLFCAGKMECKKLEPGSNENEPIYAICPCPAGEPDPKADDCRNFGYTELPPKKKMPSSVDVDEMNSFSRTLEAERIHTAEPSSCEWVFPIPPRLVEVECKDKSKRNIVCGLANCPKPADLCCEEKNAGSAKSCEEDTGVVPE